MPSTSGGGDALDPSPSRHVTEPSDPYLVRVLDVARIMCAHPDLDDEDLAERLRHVGFSSLDAELALVFVPIAFGRVILGQMEIGPFADTYFVKNRKGEWISRMTTEEPWYRAGIRVAAATVTHGYGSDECAEAPTKAEFSAAVARSPEVALVSEYLDAKRKGEPANFLPLRLFRLTVEMIEPPPRRWWPWRREPSSR